MIERCAAAAIVGFARALTGVRADWRGAVPMAEPTLYFANHASHGDFVLLWSALPAELRDSTRPVAAADYWQGSALRRFVGERVFRALLIDRRHGGVDAVAQMARALHEGDSLIMFPEGTRNTGDADLLPLKSGLYHLAVQCPDVRFVPVWIENLRRVLPKGSWLPVPLACSVAFGAPISARRGEDKAALLARARAALLALRPDAAAENADEDPDPPAAAAAITDEPPSPASEAPWTP